MSIAYLASRAATLPHTNVIDVRSCPESNAVKDVVYFALDGCHRVDVFHCRDLECFLAMLCYYHEYETIIKVESSLIEESGSVKDDLVGTSLHIGNYL